MLKTIFMLYIMKSIIKNKYCSNLPNLLVKSQTKMLIGFMCEFLFFYILIMELAICGISSQLYAVRTLSN